ncbi:DUF6264 family protein [Gulosibacter chungangensis]|uniref:Uncharacterized protein n=1 Tax=Gulosibacter chungangensis TaxID=979746 RepID=A0A7J5BCI4_9MICO|nr:DUF6264 family protein [Gulosibacter chungangensis]KAB1643268.1 hypothetical protein F8O05_08620 [Gulosibacter chungangensis]
MSNQDPTGPRGNTPGPGPVLSPEEIRKLRLRSDRMIGIMLFIIGVFATVVNMANLTGDALAQQGALAFETYGLGEYHRPADLAAIGWVGVALHPLNYAIWLYVALKRWQNRKFAAWCAFVGAVIAIVISAAVMMTAFSMHPEIIDWIQHGAPMPAPTQTP